MNINKELVRLWIDSLRSGTYQQGTSQLRTIDDKFCCLGVLCDIAKQSVNLEWNLPNVDYVSYSMGGTYSILPSVLAEYLGTVECDQRILILKTNVKLQEYLGDKVNDLLTHTTLVALNDYYKLSFDQIADILEEEFLHEDTAINVA